MARKIIVCVLSILILSGCFFSAKDIVIDPDKGTLHTHETADRDALARGQ